MYHDQGWGQDFFKKEKFLSKKRKPPIPPSKCNRFEHIGSNLKQFISANFGQKKGNPLKRGRFSSLHDTFHLYMRCKNNNCLWPCSLAITGTARLGLWFCSFMSKSTRRLNASGSDSKASQKTGPRFKVSSDRLGEAGNQTCDPWFTKRC